jgi:ElaB/YqjD/DUF883 family membrane-anchored ribosome-binding protein
MSAEDANALRAEIQVTREELGETAQALAAKTDVKARAKDAVEDAKAQAKARAKDAVEDVKVRAKQTAEEVKRRPVPPLLIGAVAAAAIALVIYARKRR